MIIAFYPGAGGNRYYRRLKNLEWKQPNSSYDHTVPEQHFENRYLTNARLSKSNVVLTHAMNCELINNFFPDWPITFITGDLQKCLKREWMLAGHERYKKKNIGTQFDRIQHYASYKDNSWPVVETLEQLELLPKILLQEINLNFEQVVNSNRTETLSGIESLTQDLILRAHSAYDMISWQTQYYQKHPPNFSKNCANIINIETDHDEFAEVMRKELDLYHSEIFDEVWKIINE
jgi:hypothetical protein